MSSEKKKKPITFQKTNNPVTIDSIWKDIRILMNRKYSVHLSAIVRDLSKEPRACAFNFADNYAPVLRLSGLEEKIAKDQLSVEEAVDYLINKYVIYEEILEDQYDIEKD